MKFWSKFYVSFSLRSGQFSAEINHEESPTRLRAVAGYAGSSPDYNLSELVKAMNIKHGTGASCHHQDAPLVPSPTGIY
jgi:hypothetical protein